MKTEKWRLLAEERTKTGTGDSKRLRNEGWIPCVMYGPDIGPKPLRVNRHELERLVARQGGQSMILELVVGGESMPNVLLKELQRDPVTDHAVHADFLQFSLTQKLSIMVSIRLLGEPIGVTQKGGILEHQTRSVEIECLPSDIINEIVLDISNLDIEGRLFVRDLSVDPKLTILTTPDTVVAAVHLPKLEEEEAKPDEAAVATEPAAEGEEKKEDEKASSPESGKPADAEKGKKKE